MRAPVAPALASLLLCMHAGVAEAAPAVGDIVSGAIEVAAGKKLPLPPGRFKVQVSAEDSAPITSSTSGGSERTEKVYVLTLVNTDPNADVPLLALDYTVHARVNWRGQPCDAATQPAWLKVQNFGSNSSSVVVRCGRVYAQSNLRRVIRGAPASTNAWERTRIGPLAAMNGQFPNNGLAYMAYLSKADGDRVNYWVTFNPGLYGLDDAEGQSSLFRNLGGNDVRIASARQYLQRVVEWGESFVPQLHDYYLAGQVLGMPIVAAPSFPGLRRLSDEALASAARGTEGGSPQRPGSQSANIAASPTASSAIAATAAPTAAAVPAQAIPSQPVQSVHALVIGNSAYGSAKLANPRNDAMAMAERFKQFGFKVMLVLDADRQQLVKALAEFSNVAKAADVGIVFYAGHGMQVGGVNYLIPVDLDLSGTRPVSVSLEALSLDSVLQDHLPGKSKLVFLDACRDNPLSRSLAATRGGATGLAPMQTSSGTLISYATRDGGTAADGSGKNSPYTTALLANLNASEDIALVLRKVRRQVLTTTQGRQEPWEYGSLLGDSLVLSSVAGPR